MNLLFYSTVDSYFEKKNVEQLKYLFDSNAPQNHAFYILDCAVKHDFYEIFEYITSRFNCRVNYLSLRDNPKKYVKRADCIYFCEYKPDLFLDFVIKHFDIKIVGGINKIVITVYRFSWINEHIDIYVKCGSRFLNLNIFAKMNFGCPRLDVEKYTFIIEKIFTLALCLQKIKIKMPKYLFLKICC